MHSLTSFMQHIFCCAYPDTQDTSGAPGVPVVPDENQGNIIRYENLHKFNIFEQGPRRDCMVLDEPKPPQVSTLVTLFSCIRLLTILSAT